MLRFPEADATNGLIVAAHSSLCTYSQALINTQNIHSVAFPSSARDQLLLWPTVCSNTAASSQSADLVQSVFLPWLHQPYQHMPCLAATRPSWLSPPTVGTATSPQASQCLLKMQPPSLDQLILSRRHLALATIPSLGREVHYCSQVIGMLLHGPQHYIEIKNIPHQARCQLQTDGWTWTRWGLPPRTPPTSRPRPSWLRERMRRRASPQPRGLPVLPPYSPKVHPALQEREKEVRGEKQPLVSEISLLGGWNRARRGWKGAPVKEPSEMCWFVKCFVCIAFIYVASDNILLKFELDPSKCSRSQRSLAFVFQERQIVQSASFYDSKEKMLLPVYPVLKMRNVNPWFEREVFTCKRWFDWETHIIHIINIIIHILTCKRWSWQCRTRCREVWPCPQWNPSPTLSFIHCSWCNWRNCFFVFLCF